MGWARVPRRRRAGYSRRPAAGGPRSVFCRQLPCAWLHLRHHLSPPGESRDPGAGSWRYRGSSSRCTMGHGPGVRCGDAVVCPLRRGHHHRRAHGTSARHHGRNPRRKPPDPPSSGAGGGQRHLRACPCGGLSRHGLGAHRHRSGHRAGRRGQESGALSRPAALLGGVHVGWLWLARPRRLPLAAARTVHRLCL